MSACDDDRHFEIPAELLHAGKGNCQRNSSSSSYSKPTVAGTCLSVRVDVLKLRQAACGAYHK